MKPILITLVLLGVTSCKEVPKKSVPTSEEVKMEMETPQKEYPETLIQVFDAHGGLANWKKKRTLTFTISKPDATEVHTIDLYDRRGKIEMPVARMGFDGDAIMVVRSG